MALRLRGATSGYIELKAPASAGDNTLTLPTNNGSANQLLKTDGSGNLSWVDDNSGVSLSGSTNNTIATVTGANALAGEANFTFDGDTAAITRSANTAAGLSISNTNNSQGSAIAQLELSGGDNAHARLQFECNAVYNTIRSDGTGNLRVFKGSDERFCIVSNGDVGVGITTPTTQSGRVLHLHAPNQQRFHMTNATTGSSSTDGFEIIVEEGTNVRIRNFEAGALMFDSGGPNNEAMRINSAGNVGIGTTNPLRKFHVEDSNSELALFSSTKATGSYVNFKLGANGAELGMIGSGAEILSGGADASDFGIRAVGDICISSGGHAERMRIDASGRLLIATTASFNGGILCIGSGQGTNHPSGEGVKLAPTANTITFLDSSSNTSDKGNIQLWNTIYNNCSAKVELYHPAANTGGIQLHTHDGTNLVERLMVLQNGVVLIQATSSDMNSADNLGYTFTRHTTSPYLRVKHGGSGSGYANHTLIHFVGASSMIGEVKQDGDGTITYASSSDYRLKENIVDLTGAITRLKNLKPKRFNFKINSGLTKDGFLAHELQEVVPESVNGTKDEVVTADSKVNNPALADLEIGDPVYQTADASRVVPLITAALKEAIAKIETLETKVAALESA
jgi:hypothetical protein